MEKILKKILIALVVFIKLSAAVLSLPSVVPDIWPYVQANDLELVKDLLMKGADVNKRSVYGDTPLSIAISNQNFAIFALLLLRKADPDLENSDGSTPLGLARYYMFKDLYNDDENSVSRLIKKALFLSGAKQDKFRESHTMEVTEYYLNNLYTYNEMQSNLKDQSEV